ncbi:MAG TPA: choice-of-anchor tandem repeat GloVer-containing protein, partial [Chthoniobacterales bacterium]|nr:choice-of-anchor tandem repeat GloVer-containing protein [Chthoniobacterales bacterium]
MLALAIAMLGVLSLERADAQLTILHRFGDGSVPNDGAYPRAALAVGPDNDLYGVTETKAQYINGGSGTVFRITPSGTLTIIKSFPHKLYMVSEGPLLNYNGTLVGVTGGGPRRRGLGTLFELTPAVGSQQWNLNIAFKFGLNNVLGPSGSVIVGSDGDFYGTTEGTSTTTGAGTIYKMDPQTFTLTVLYDFTTSGAMSPQGALLQGSDGNFYGSTEQFAFNFTASIFMMTPDGQVTILSQIPGQFSYV